MLKTVPVRLSINCKEYSESLLEEFLEEIGFPIAKIVKTARIGRSPSRQLARFASISCYIFWRNTSTSKSCPFCANGVREAPFLVAWPWISLSSRPGKRIRSGLGIITSTVSRQIADFSCILARLESNVWQDVRCKPAMDINIFRDIPAKFLFRVMMRSKSVSLLVLKNMLIYIHIDIQIV